MIGSRFEKFSFQTKAASHAKKDKHGLGRIRTGDLRRVKATS